MDSNRRISVVVPAYNEEKRLPATLGKLYSYFRDHFHDFEIILVDDGSADRTKSIVENFVQEHPRVRLISYSPNRGKGFAVRTGILAAKGNFILFSDADLSTPPEEIPKLINAIHEGADIAIGSRALALSAILKRQPAYRMLMGKTFNKMVKLIAVRGIQDTQCGFKCFRAGAAKEIFSRCKINGFGFDVEALFLGRKLGYSIRELGITWINEEDSRVHPVYHSLQMARELIQIRFFSLSGGYQLSSEKQQKETALARIDN